MEGFTEHEIVNYAEAIIRRGKAFAEIPPVRPELPWSTVSGFADRTCFCCALARSWPIIPRTGDLVTILKIFRCSMPVILNSSLTLALPLDELSF
jgi:hypothetical protein